MADFFELPASRIMFLHGHREFESNSLKVYSHEHPVLRFRDEVGAQVAIPCFLFDEQNNIIIMPAFSPLTSGTNVISPEESFMSPGLRNLDLGQARVFVILNGIMEFGRVGDLRRMLDWASFQAMIKNRRSSFQ